MNVLVLTKRQYTNKDLLDDKYGRLRQIPLALAERGHSVHGICLSYRSKPDGVVVDKSQIAAAQVTWKSISLNRLIAKGLYRYISVLRKEFKEVRPDIIWASSDCFHIIAGVSAGRFFGVPCIADLYDNYEYFIRHIMPFVIPPFRMAVRRASGVTYVSNTLAEHIRQSCQRTGHETVIENAIDTLQFLPLEKQHCRKSFNLPQNARIIGTAGALDESRDIQTLYDAFERLSRQDPDIHLVLAGSLKSDKAIRNQSRIHYLGELNHDQIPKLINAFDVGIICNKDSGFGRYCFPQKAYEMIGCGIPIVVAGVGAMKELFHDTPEVLYEPGNATKLAQAVFRQLETPYKIQCRVPTWENQALKLENLAKEILESRPKID